MRIYLGCRISGLPYDVIVDYLESTKTALAGYGYEVLQPMTGKEDLRNSTKMLPAGYKSPTATNHAIFERDMWMVRQCDIFYLNLERTDDFVSIGGVMELSAASLLGKHTVVVIPTDNKHEHAFVYEAADVVFRSHEEAMSYLAKVAPNGFSREKE